MTYRLMDEPISVLGFRYNSNRSRRPHRPPNNVIHPTPIALSSQAVLHAAVRAVGPYRGITGAG